MEEYLELFQLDGQRDKNPFQLSMGQKRRLSVAATIIQGQQLILLDEPIFRFGFQKYLRFAGIFGELPEKGRSHPDGDPR